MRAMPERNGKIDHIGSEAIAALARLAKRDLLSREKADERYQGRDDAATDEEVSAMLDEVFGPEETKTP